LKKIDKHIEKNQQTHWQLMIYRNWSKKKQKRVTRVLWSMEHGEARNAWNAMNATKRERV